MKITKKIFQQYESEARGYCRRFDPVFTSASGSIMRDVDGNEYIDFLAACGSLNYGHNDPDMQKALIEYIQDSGITASLDLFSVAKGAFLNQFHKLILKPRNLDYRIQFTGPTGSNAVEAAMKLARKVTGRTNIISFTNGFHGVTMGSLSATGNKYNRMGCTFSGVSRMPFEGYLGGDLDSVAYLDKLLSDPSSGVEAPAAILLETVQGEGGLNAASSKWIQQVAAIAKRHSALLIIDDIQAGCGRTGTFFSFEPFGIDPDIVCLSKSISGYGLPMAVVLIKPEHDQWEPAEHNGTFRGNAHAFVTARVALEKFWSDTAFSHEILTKAKLITKHLQRISKVIPGSYLKGRGMMQGICLDSGELASKICQRCFEKGLIIETSGPDDEVIKILVALTISADLLEEGLNIIESVAIDVMRDSATFMGASVTSSVVNAVHLIPETSPLTLLDHEQCWIGGGIPANTASGSRRNGSVD